MKIVFFGTPEYVVPVVKLLNKKLKKGNETPVVAVVTQKPKPTGRKQFLAYSAVDTWAHKRGVPIYFNPLDVIENKVDAEIGVLASYGAIVPGAVINYFKYGIINIHPSLLPKFRGASPVQATLVTNSQAGATLIKIDSQLDHGPILAQFKEDTLVDDTTKTLRDRLFVRAAEVIVGLIPAYMAGKIKIKAQNHAEATTTRQIKKEDTFIPPKYLNAALQGRTLKNKWNIPFIKDCLLVPNANCLERFIRAMNPWPIAWTFVKLNPVDKEPKRLKIIKAHLKPKSVNEKRSMDFSLIIDEVQLEGKTEVSWKQFTEGYPKFAFPS